MKKCFKRKLQEHAHVLLHRTACTKGQCHTPSMHISLVRIVDEVSGGEQASSIGPLLLHCVHGHVLGMQRVPGWEGVSVGRGVAQQVSMHRNVCWFDLEVHRG